MLEYYPICLLAFASMSFAMGIFVVLGCEAAERIIDGSIRVRLQASLRPVNSRKQSSSQVKASIGDDKSCFK